MISLLDIHSFWVELFPIFQNGYEFVYIFFDVVSILAFIEAFIVLPGRLLFGGTNKVWND